MPAGYVGSRAVARPGTRNTCTLPYDCAGSGQLWSWTPRQLSCAAMMQGGSAHAPQDARMPGLPTHRAASGCRHSCWVPSGCARVPGWCAHTPQPAATCLACMGTSTVNACMGDPDSIVDSSRRIADCWLKRLKPRCAPSSSPSVNAGTWLNHGCQHDNRVQVCHRPGRGLLSPLQVCAALHL